MARATRQELYQREVEIREYLEKGTPVSVFATDMARKWKCSDSAIRKQYSDVMDSLTKEMKENNDNFRQELILRNDKIFREAMLQKKLKVAIDANHANAKLMGLFDTDNASSPETPKFIEVEEKDFSLELVDTPEDKAKKAE